MRAIPGRQAQAVTAYRILVAGDTGTLARDEGDLWDSGRLTGPQPICVGYAGKPLQSFKRCFWKVKL